MGMGMSTATVTGWYGDGDVLRQGWMGMDSNHAGMSGDGLKSDPRATVHSK